MKPVFSTPSYLVGLALALLMACGNPSTPSDPLLDAPTPADPSVPSAGDVLVVAVPYDPMPLSPLAPGFALREMITALVHPGLARRSTQQAQVTFGPGLAERWDASPDGRSLTYALPPDARWEDGTPLTADDVTFTWSTLTDPALGTRWTHRRDVVKSVAAEDSHRVVWTFDRARRPHLLQSLTIFPILPKHRLADASHEALRERLASTEVPASGPFRIERWEPGRSLVLAPNVGATGGAGPYLGHVVFRVIPRYATRIEALKKGTVDMVVGIDPSDAASLQSNPNIELAQNPSASMRYVGYDLRDPRFSDPRVRRALTTAIDRERLIRELFVRGGTQLGRYSIGTVSHTQGGWFASEVLPLPYDPRGAISLLEAAGWRDTDKDGVRDRDRGRQRLAFEVLIQDTSPTTAVVADRIQQSWTSIGVQATIVPLPPTEFHARVAARDFDAFLWGYPVNPAVDLTWAWSSNGPQNWGGYTSREVDRLLVDAATTLDTPEAQRMIRDAQRKIHDDHPVSFLFWQDDLAAFDRRLRRVQASPYTWFENLEQWYVPLAEQKHRGLAPDLPPPPSARAPSPR